MSQTGNLGRCLLLLLRTHSAHLVIKEALIPFKRNMPTTKKVFLREL